VAGLEDLYREIVLDHYRNPRHRGSLPCPPAHRAEGFNPLCGDEIVVYAERGPGGELAVRTEGQGCSISQSSASMMAAAVDGAGPSAARALSRAFKAMMSIHEHRLDAEADVAGGDGSGAAEGGGGAPDLGELAALQGVVKFPVRIKCATLSWNTLAQVLDEIEAG